MCKRILTLLVVALALPMAAFADSRINFVIPNSLNLSLSATLLGELDGSGNLLDSSNVTAIDITADTTTSNDVLNQNQIFGPGSLTVIGTGSDEDNRLYLTYYASDEDHARWKEEFPDEELPTQRKPACTRS